ncbi:MAG TPA: hypothetical protein ENI87_15660 [bacterium]|nr:hypothetical protein [bacterium]
MNAPWPRPIEAVSDGLPALPADGELILRADRLGMTATIRAHAAPPRVFRLREGALAEELRVDDDDALMAARVLAEPDALVSLLPDGFGAPAALELVAWRPRRRAVLRVRGERGDTCWLKFLDRKAWRRAERAFAAFGEAAPPLCLVRPFALSAELRAYVARPAAGASLRERLQRSEPVQWPLLALALRSLAAMPAAGELPELGFDHARAATVGMLQKACSVWPQLEELVAGIGALRAPRPAAAGLVHGDLHDKQVFVAGSMVSLIDLEGIGRGDPRIDVANFVEHLRLRDLQARGEDSGLADTVARRCANGAADRDLRTLRLLVRARLCGVYALRPRWHDLVVRLVHEVATGLEELR